MQISKTERVTEKNKKKTLPPLSSKIRDQYMMEANAHLLKIAKTHGFEIKAVGNDRFKLTGTNDLKRVCPSFIKREGDTFDWKNLKTFLQFLHQPIRTSLENQSIITKPDDSHRINIHRALRFLQSGSVIIPDDKYEELENEIYDCHAAIEQEMRDFEKWQDDPEFGNTETSLASLPDTEIHLSEGFKFKISKHGIQTQNTTTLSATLWNALQKEKTEQTGDTLTLSADEMARFIQNIPHDPLATLLEQCEIEEKIQTRLQSIKIRAANNAAYKKKNPEQKLKDLLKVTSALSSIISQETTREILARHKYSERNTRLLENIRQDLTVMHTVAGQLSENTPTPSELQAFYEEFSSPLLFMREISEYLASPKAKHALEQVAQSLEAKIIDKSYTTLAECFKKATNNAGSLKRQAMNGAKEFIMDFGGDMINFIKEKPALAGIAIIGALAMWHYGPGIEFVDNPLETIIPSLDGDFEVITLDPEKIPDGDKEFTSSHWDMGLFGFYKHVMFSGAIRAPSEKMIEWFQAVTHTAYDIMGAPQNKNPEFTKAANEAVVPTLRTWFPLNTFQNFTHALWWMYTFNFGWKHKGKGAKKITKLMAPITDLAIQAMKERPLAIPTATVATSIMFAMSGQNLSDIFENAENKMHLISMLVSKSIPAVIIGGGIGGYLGSKLMKNELPIDTAILNKDIETLPEAPIEPPPKKGKAGMLLKSFAAAAAAITIPCIALDMAGAGNELTNTISRNLGSTAGIGITSFNFWLYNALEDWVIIHVGSGLSLAGLGALSGAFHEKAVKPVASMISKSMTHRPPQQSPQPALEKN